MAAQLVVLEALLTVGVVLLYGARIEVPWMIAVSCVLGTIGLAATGTLYGALSSGLRVRETLLPFLLLPIAAPVLLAGTRIWQAAMAGGVPAQGTAMAAAPRGVRCRLPRHRRRPLRPHPGDGMTNDLATTPLEGRRPPIRRRPPPRTAA